MNIKVRWLDHYGYADVVVSTSHTTVELGLHDELERRELAGHLREVAEELWPLEEGEQ